MSRREIHNGDCREVLKTLADCSVDSIVTDPPYELGFMGKGWDKSGIAYDVSVWIECLRVLKPGGHLLAFGGSRTYHRLACAIEDAGFEIRDQIQWIYGSGFPKSLDVSKAIDARGGESVAWFGSWLRQERQRRGLTQKDLAVHFPSKNNGLTGCVANWELGLNLPTPDQFNLLCGVLDLPFARIEEAERDVICRNDRPAGWFTNGDGHNVTAPASSEAKQWSGWGTALKPAHEPIVMARKPLIGTVAENVLQHGTGGLNIDRCRVEGANGDGHWTHKREIGDGNIFNGGGQTDEDFGNQNPNVLGRWPANVIHDGSDEVLARFPSVDGPWGGNGSKSQCGATSMFGIGDNPNNENYKGSGSAARFFYCAKANVEEREDGCDELPHRVADTQHKRPRTELDDPRRAGVTPRQNNHPTVKPTDLMRYLCRLVTPPGGTVLDPFCGSGSTGRGATLEGFNFIGIDANAEYCEIAERRINAVTKQGLLMFA